MNRWIVYQRERFPLAAHGALVGAFSVSAVAFSSLVRDATARPSAASFLVAFVTSLLFFLQLRIADEFKDFDDDARYRPYRPVPRGLVSLRALGWVGIASAGIQLGAALVFAPSLAWLLVVVWLYLGLMAREFFAPRWLKRHPVAYMTSHMVILPLVDLYATACDWWIAGLRVPPRGLYWFLIVSYLNGLVIEIGRKTRTPPDEETGVDTYSALWGTGGAVRAWLFVVLLTAAAAWQAAARLGTAHVMLVVLLALVAACAIAAARLLRDQRRGAGQSIERMSAVWTIVMYLALGAAPLAMRWWRG